MARRIFCILLAVLLAVPFAAFAVVNAATVKVYTRWDASAEPFELTEGVDFTWTYTDASQSGITLQFPQGSPATASPLRVEIADGRGRKMYFFDPINNSEWVDLSRVVQGEQASFSLVDADTLAYVDGATLSVSSAQGADNNTPDLVGGGDSGIGGGVEVIGPSLTPTMPRRIAVRHYAAVSAGEPGERESAARRNRRRQRQEAVLLRPDQQQRVGRFEPRRARRAGFVLARRRGHAGLC